MKKTQIALCSFTTFLADYDYGELVKILQRYHGLHLHHIATKRGYVSRKLSGRCEEYKGRFGKGFIVLRPRWDTTQYVYCEYWVK